MIKEYFRDFKILGDNAKEFWVIQAATALDLAAFVSLLAVATLYLTQNIGTSADDVTPVPATSWGAVQFVAQTVLLPSSLHAHSIRYCSLVFEFQLTLPPLNPVITGASSSAIPESDYATVQPLQRPVVRRPHTSIFRRKPSRKL